MLELFLNEVNAHLKEFEPWEIVFGSFFIWQFGFILVSSIFSFLSKNWIAIGFKLLRKLPYIKEKINDELDKNVQEMESEIKKQIQGKTYITHLPNAGWTKSQILSEIDQMMALGEYKAEKGALSGTCHKQPNVERVEVVTEAYSKTAYANPLNPDAFPGIRKMEAEVVRICCNLFHGDPDTSCGTMTSGGTESLILACKAYKEFAKREKGVEKPNMVLPTSAHVGFEKAAHMMDIELRYVPIAEDYMPNMKKMRSKIDKNTIMLVASAPQYPQGLIEPIEKIGKLALDYGLPLHIDACLGGFLLAFSEECGMNTEPFDFKVPGVTSISADTHKFGYAPKGSSVILYREKKYIHCQYYISTNWSGGLFVSPTMAGSRSGGIIAATWSALLNYGVDGYIEASKAIFDTLSFIVEAIRKIPELEVMGDPKVCIVAFKSNKFNVYSLGDEMKKKGWLLSAMQYPTCIHLYITPMHTQKGIKEKFVMDLSNVVDDLKKDTNKPLDGRAAMYGMAQKIPDSSLIEEIAESFIDTLYSTK